MTDPRIDGYDWAGGREPMLRFGPETGPVAVIALPLFEEANRTRAFGATLLRALAARGIAGALPELPGTGESMVATADATLLKMRSAFETAVEHVGAEGRRCYAVGIRSGALFDLLSSVFGRWHLAPQLGEDLLREQLRLAQIGGGLSAGSDIYTLIGSPEPIIIAGNVISNAIAADLLGATTYDQPGVPLRTVRLETDPRPAELKVPGTPLWRRAEPGNDPVLAQRLAEDIAAWIVRCEA